MARNPAPVHDSDPERTVATGVAQRPVVAVRELDLVDDVPVRVGQRRTDRVAPDERRQPLEDGARGQRLTRNWFRGQHEPQRRLVGLGEK